MAWEQHAVSCCCRMAEQDGMQSPGMGGQAGAPDGQQRGGLGMQGAGGEGRGQYKYTFNIGSIDSFERKMEEAQVGPNCKSLKCLNCEKGVVLQQLSVSTQEDLGWAPSSWVPITYTNELSWQQELLRLAPTILLIAGYVWFTRRQMGGLGGGGGMGGRGIFNVGKAQARALCLSLTFH